MEGKLGRGELREVVCREEEECSSTGISGDNDNYTRYILGRQRFS